VLVDIASEGVLEEGDVGEFDQPEELEEFGSVSTGRIVGERVLRIWGENETAPRAGRELDGSLAGRLLELLTARRSLRSVVALAFDVVRLVRAPRALDAAGLAAGRAAFGR
jgi:hypothetical protein